MKKSVFIIFSLLSLFSCNVHPKSNNQIKKTEVKRTVLSNSPDKDK